MESTTEGEDRQRERNTLHAEIDAQPEQQEEQYQQEEVEEKEPCGGIGRKGAGGHFP